MLSMDLVLAQLLIHDSSGSKENLMTSAHEVIQQSSSQADING
jgi:hypothetical protein